MTYLGKARPVRPQHGPAHRAAALATTGLIVVTGDPAAGPQPTAVLDRPLALSDRAVPVRGNADRDLVALANGPPRPSETPTPSTSERRGHVLRARRAGSIINASAGASTNDEASFQAERGSTSAVTPCSPTSAPW